MAAERRDASGASIAREVHVVARLLEDKQVFRDLGDGGRHFVVGGEHLHLVVKRAVLRPGEDVLMQEVPSEFHGGLLRKFLLGVPCLRDVAVELRLSRRRIKLLPRENSERVAVKTVEPYEGEVALFHRLTTERAGGVEDVLATGEFGDLTELLLGELDVEEGCPLLDAEEVLAHQSPRELVMDRTLEAATEHELGDTLRVVGFGTESGEMIGRHPESVEGFERCIHF